MPSIRRRTPQGSVRQPVRRSLRPGRQVGRAPQPSSGRTAHSGHGSPGLRVRSGHRHGRPGLEPGQFRGQLQVGRGHPQGTDRLPLWGRATNGRVDLAPGCELGKSHPRAGVLGPHRSGGYGLPIRHRPHVKLRQQSGGEGQVHVKVRCGGQLLGWRWWGGEADLDRAGGRGRLDKALEDQIGHISGQASPRGLVRAAQTGEGALRCPVGSGGSASRRRRNATPLRCCPTRRGADS